MKEPVVVAHSGDSGPTQVMDSESGWKLLFVLGTGLAIVGLMDFALPFLSPQWASLAWEFGTVSGAFEGMPIIALGLGLMTAAAVANGWLWTRRVMMFVTLMMALIVMVLGVVLVLDVPPALRATPEPLLKHQLKLASVKTSLMAATYFVLYLALGVWTWRRLRATKVSRRPA